MKYDGFDRHKILRQKSYHSAWFLHLAVKYVTFHITSVPTFPHHKIRKAEVPKNEECKNKKIYIKSIIQHLASWKITLAGFKIIFAGWKIILSGGNIILPGRKIIYSYFGRGDIDLHSTWENNFGRWDNCCDRGEIILAGGEIDLADG